MNEAEILACESVSDLFTFISSMTSRLWAADRLIAVSTNSWIVCVIPLGTVWGWVLIGGQLQHGYKAVIKHADIEARCKRRRDELVREEEAAEGRSPL
jgi:hypothetical protein